MNSMLKYVLLAAGLAAATLTGVRADDNPAPPAPGDAGAPAPAPNPAMEPHGAMGPRLERLTTVLDLTSAQQQQVSAIFAASAQQRQVIMNEPLSEADRHTKLRTLMTDTQAKFRGALTLDQQKKLDALPHPWRDHGDHADHWGHRGPKEGGPAGGPPAPAAAEPPPGTPAT
jgi:hypothetical protein